MINKDFFKLVKRYKFKSVFIQMATKMVLFILIPLIIISICFVVFYYNNLNTQLHEYKSNQNYSICTEWEDIQRFIIQNNTFLSSSQFADFFYSADSIDDITSEREKILNLITVFQNSAVHIEYFDSIYLYSDSLKYILGTNSSSTYDKFWDKDLLENRDNFAYDTVLVRTNGFNKRNLTFLHKFPENTENLLVYNFDYDFMIKSLKKKYSNIDNVYIYDSDGEILFSYNTEEIGSNFKNLGDFSNLDTINFSPDGTPFSVLTVYSSNNSANIIKSYSFALIILIIALTIIAIITSFQITISFYKSLVECIVVMRDIVGDSVEAENEAKLIGNSVLQLSLKQQEFEKNLAKNVVELKKSQVVALQEQINPHFIFNTLNLISMLDLSEEKTNHTISDIVSELSVILRFVLNNDTYFITFKKEIFYLEKYINLQNYKYGEKLNVSIDIPDDIMEKKIIKFSLQPIVENAIIHGKNPNIKNFMIKISAKQAGDMIIIDIFNTGKNIDSDTLQKLKKQLSSDLPLPNKHIGLANVNLRYKYVFGEQFGCSITSSEKGVNVRIKMPCNIE